jgi:hypothetical protein
MDSGVVEGRPLPPESDSLSPLPEVLQSGLTAVAVLAGISLFTSTALFLHLTWKLIAWRLSLRREAREARNAEPPSPGVDLALGLAERHFGNSELGVDAEVNRRRKRRKEAKRYPNQFLIFFYNLLLADIQQSLAFFINAVWVTQRSITVRTSTCWAQGWFISNGDLSASLFISAIAVHTYCTIVRGYRPPQWTIFASCAGIWIFTYGMTSVGLIATGNGRNDGGFYVRAAAWVSLDTCLQMLVRREKFGRG